MTQPNDPSTPGPSPRAGEEQELTIPLGENELLLVATKKPQGWRLGYRSGEDDSYAGWANELEVCLLTEIARLRAAAQGGEGERLRQFEKLCDDAWNAYVAWYHDGTEDEHVDAKDDISRKLRALFLVRKPPNTVPELPSPRRSPDHGEGGGER